MWRHHDGRKGSTYLKGQPDKKCVTTTTKTVERTPGTTCTHRCTGPPPDPPSRSPSDDLVARNNAALLSYAQYTYAVLAVFFFICSVFTVDCPLALFFLLLSDNVAVSFSSSCMASSTSLLPGRFNSSLKPSVISASIPRALSSSNPMCMSIMSCGGRSGMHPSGVEWSLRRCRSVLYFQTVVGCLPGRAVHRGQEIGPWSKK